jgi:hypothetical protein
VIRERKMEDYLPFLVFAAIFALVWVTLKILSKGSGGTDIRSRAEAELERRRRRDEAELALKKEMIERGMSADEIERVLKASAEEKPR